LLKGYTGLEQSWWWEVQQENLQVPVDTPPNKRSDANHGTSALFPRKRERGRERKNTKRRKKP
jgi:hypothetical protein